MKTTKLAFLFLLGLIFWGACTSSVEEIENIPISQTVEGLYLQADGINELELLVVGDRQVQIQNSAGDYLDQPLLLEIEGRWEFEDAILYRSRLHPNIELWLYHTGESKLKFGEVYGGYYGQRIFNRE